VNKKKGPALYELILSKPSYEPTSPQSILKSKTNKKSNKAKKVEDIDLDHNVLTPGRSIRVSIGSIGVIAAVCIALIVISYTMGFQKGSAVASEDVRAQYGDQLFEEFSSQEAGTISVVPSQSSPTKAVVRPSDQPATSKQHTVGPLLSDPRMQNAYYYTLMQTTKEGAIQLATFCRQKGLETYVVSGNNTRLFRVIAFPGAFDSNAQSLRTVQLQIHAIGQEWADTMSGRGSDLKDAYISINTK